MSKSTRTGKKLIEYLGDLTEMSVEKEMKAVAQGKSHVNFYESQGKLYFSTHLGYYSIKDGMEVPGIDRTRTDLVAIPDPGKYAMKYFP
jgi:hypothetical protein